MNVKILYIKIFFLSFFALVNFLNSVNRKVKSTGKRENEKKKKKKKKKRL